jgi:hypothetical protein
MSGPAGHGSAANNIEAIHQNNLPADFGSPAYYVNQATEDLEVAISRYARFMTNNNDRNPTTRNNYIQALRDLQGLVEHALGVAGVAEGGRDKRKRKVHQTRKRLLKRTR